MADEAATKSHGCFMTQGLYLKANGELPCWDDVGENKILRTLDAQAVQDGREIDISRFDALKHIRTSFAKGAYPYPGLCERCAVRSAGLPHADVDPAVLQVLHVEPSYMCHLSCPQCIPQKLRKSLKNPPYHLAPATYEGFLRQLRSEGVAQIKLVIFEGRGDPLSCPDLEQLVALTKQYYPTSSTCITTHGSFPYKDWIARSKLDVIRFSVDGARQENYAKYRIGGKLETIFKFMTSLQQDRKTGSRLYAEWKYILFEWNDSDEELAEAAALAIKFGVQLRFCRTHSPGRSQIYDSAKSVADMIKRLAPRALQDLTFQLKDDADFAQVDVVRADQLRGLVRIATEHAALGDVSSACAGLLEALSLDGGFDALPGHFDGYDDARAFILHDVDRMTLAQTPALLAAFFKGIGHADAIGPLLTRYVALAPDAVDREHVRTELRVGTILEAHRRGDGGAVDARVCELFDAEPGTDLSAFLLPALAMDHPGVAAAMANIFEQRGQIDAATLLFEKYLSIAPHADDHEQVSRHAARLRRDRLMAMAVHQHRAGNRAHSVALAAEAQCADRSAAGQQTKALSDIARRAVGADYLQQLSELAVEAGDFEAAYIAEHRLRTEGELGT